MEKIKSLADLKKKREQLQSMVGLRENGDNAENLVQIKVAMATCGIASGAKQTMEAIIEECKNQNVLGCRNPNRLYGLLLCRAHRRGEKTRQRPDRFRSCGRTESQGPRQQVHLEQRDPGRRHPC